MSARPSRGPVRVRLVQPSDGQVGLPLRADPCISRRRSRRCSRFRSSCVRRGGEAAAARADGGRQHGHQHQIVSATGEQMTIIASVPPTVHGRLGAISKTRRRGRPATTTSFELLQAADAAEARRSSRPPRRSLTRSSCCRGRSGADAGRREGRGGEDPVRQRRPPLSKPDAATTTMLGNNYPDRRAAAGGHHRWAEVRGQRRRDPGPRRHRGHHDRGASRTSQSLPDGGLKEIVAEPADFDPDAGLKVMENILQALEEIDAGTRTTMTWRRAWCRRSATPARRRDVLTGVGGRGRDEADQGGWPVPRDLPLQPEHGRQRGQHGPPARPRRGLPGARSPGGSPPAHRAGRVVTKDNVDEYEQYAFN